MCGNCRCAFASPYGVVSSEKIREWRRFSEAVEQHIRDYTIPQYGDGPDAMIESQDVEFCWQQIERYLRRRNVAVRGREEQIRDVLKVAHYASFIWRKMRETPPVKKD